MCHRSILVWDVTSGDDMHDMFLGANTLYQTGLFRAATAAPVVAATAMLLLSYCHVSACCYIQIQILLMSCCYHSAASMLMSFCYFHDVDAILLLIFCCCHSATVILLLPCCSCPVCHSAVSILLLLMSCCDVSCFSSSL